MLTIAMFPEPTRISEAASFIYVGSPFWHKSQHIREWRVKRSARLVTELIELFSLAYFYNPLTHSSYTNATEDYWRNHGLAMLAAASVLLVYEQKGWQSSVGLALEIAHAEQYGKPIYYLPEQD